MSGEVFFAGVMTAVVLERGVELLLSRRNVRRARAAGAVESGAAHYPWMVLLHASFLVACPVEVWALGRPFFPLLAASMLGVLCLSMGLRYWAIATLKGRWSTRVLCVPGEPAVVTGPYRYLRHPNYLAVVMEIAALPLVHTAWWTALVYTVANGLLLRVRIRVEEEALRLHGHYDERFGGGSRSPSMTPGAGEDPGGEGTFGRVSR